MNRRQWGLSVWSKKHRGIVILCFPIKRGDGKGSLPVPPFNWVYMKVQDMFVLEKNRESHAPCTLSYRTIFEKFQKILFFPLLYYFCTQTGVELDLKGTDYRFS